VTNSVSLRLAMQADFNVFLEKSFALLHPGVPFQPNGHLEMLAWYMRSFMEGKIQRLVVCLPPRHLKSMIGSVALPAWMLGHNPAAKIICASYGEDLAKEFSTNCRHVMNSDIYKQAFPAVQIDKSTEMHLRTQQGGFRFSTTTGGALTGMGADFVIVDDPMKYQDIESEVRRDEVAKWFFNLPTRLNNPNAGGIMVIAQRMHEDDVIGRIIEKGGWTIVKLPLIALEDECFPRGPNLFYRRKAGELLHPARINRQQAEQLRVEIGKAAFDAQYQQSPGPAGGGYFDPLLLKRYTEPPAAFEYTFFSVDNATVADGGDFSVCTIWGYVDENFYLLDVWRKQVTLPQLRKAIVDLDRQWNPSLIVVETVGSGTALYQDLREQLGRYVQGCTPKGNKSQRFEAVTLLMEKGQVWFPSKAPWLEALMKELMAFPNSKYDDQVDSISQVLFYRGAVLQRARVQGNPKGPRSDRIIPTLKVNFYSLDTSSMPDLW
jgi:predicted phage terminase large subunit-like protein